MSIYEYILTGPGTAKASSKDIVLAKRIKKTTEDSEFNKLQDGKFYPDEGGYYNEATNLFYVSSDNVMNYDTAVRFCYSNYPGYRMIEKSEAAIRNQADRVPPINGYSWIRTRDSSYNGSFMAWSRINKNYSWSSYSARALCVKPAN